LGAQVREVPRRRSLGDFEKVSAEEQARHTVEAIHVSSLAARLLILGSGIANVIAVLLAANEADIGVDSVWLQGVSIERYVEA